MLAPSFVNSIPVSAAETPTPASVHLRIMETTDLHANMVNFDYYSLKEDNTLGFAKTASLIKQARTESDNSLLFDNGDVLQGNPLGDYVAKVSNGVLMKPTQFMTL